MYETNNTGYYLVLLAVLIGIVYFEHKGGKPYKKISAEFGIAFGAIFIIRSFFLDIFQIPSGSMVNNLLVGDIPIVLKWSYGYDQYSLWLSESYAPDSDFGRVFESLPKRGDVVVFRLPSQPSVNFVKRVVGLPGDRVQVKDGVVYINDKPANMAYDKDYLYQNDKDEDEKYVMNQYLETLPDTDKAHIVIKLKNPPQNKSYAEYLKTRNNTNVYYVPEDHLFMMGDNRDFSNDSRNLNEVGFVHKRFLIGKVWRLLFSMGGHVKMYEPHRWLFNIRYSRLFKAVN